MGSRLIRAQWHYGVAIYRHPEDDVHSFALERDELAVITGVERSYWTKSIGRIARWTQILSPRFGLGWFIIESRPTARTYEVVK